MVNKSSISKRVVVFLLLVSGMAKAQVERGSTLYQSIMANDSLLFNVGFNTCHLQTFEDLLSNQFEFFHDKSGKSDKNKFLKDLRGGLCAHPDTYQARRELLPGSTQVFALYDQGTLYGAIQQGVHQFYEKQPGQAEKFGSSAPFTHLWLLESGQWKLAKSLSYEHQIRQLPLDSFQTNEDVEMEKWLKEMHVPTLGIGYIEQGKLKQVKVYGEITQGVSAPYNTIFNVASLTKPVTAVVALKLVGLGKWNLDEPLSHYWIDPDIAQDPRHRKITTRLVLSHQTGFENWRLMHQDKKLHFLFEPGTTYHYSGEGFEYLRKALEKKFHKTLQQLARELLFEPLKMTDTRYVWQAEIDTTRLALPFDKDGKTYPTVKSKTPNAADDLMTTVADYGNFLASLIRGELLTPALFKEMSQGQVASSKGKYFGLGVEIYDLADSNFALSHGGADHGVQCIVFVFPKTQQGLLIFTNVDDGYKVYEKLLVKYLGAYGKQIIDIETK